MYRIEASPTALTGNPEECEGRIIVCRDFLFGSKAELFIFLSKGSSGIGIRHECCTFHPQHLAVLFTSADIQRSSVLHIDHRVKKRKISITFPYGKGISVIFKGS